MGWGGGGRGGGRVGAEAGRFGVGAHFGPEVLPRSGACKWFCGRLRSSFEVSRWCLYSIAYSVTYGSRIW